MSNTSTRTLFADTQEGLNVITMLKAMVESDLFHTNASYSSNSSLYPDNSMSFVEKHMAYLVTHPKVDVDKYISNLRLMTRIRR